jgi:hypothetical protein
MKSKKLHVASYVAVLVLVFVIGYFLGTGKLNTDLLFSSVYDADDLNANIETIESNSILVYAREYPADFPEVPYLGKLDLQSLSKMNKEGVENYLIHLNAALDAPQSLLDILKKEFEADGWQVQIPEPKEDTFTFHAEKGELVANAVLQAFGTAGTDLTMALKVL